MSVNITYRLGYYFRKPVLSYYSLFYLSGRAMLNYSQRWQQPGDEKITNVPAIWVYLTMTAATEVLHQYAAINV